MIAPAYDSTLRRPCFVSLSWLGSALPRCTDPSRPGPAVGVFYALQVYRHSSGSRTGM